jgi:hypothetical protein
MAIASLVGPAKPLGGKMFYVIPTSPNTKSAGQALSVSLVKPGAYLSMSYVTLFYVIPLEKQLVSLERAQRLQEVRVRQGSVCLWRTFTHDAHPVITDTQERMRALFYDYACTSLRQLCEALLYGFQKSNPLVTIDSTSFPIHRFDYRASA